MSDSWVVLANGMDFYKLKHKKELYQLELKGTETVQNEMRSLAPQTSGQKSSFKYCQHWLSVMGNGMWVRELEQRPTGSREKSQIVSPWEQNKVLINKWVIYAGMDFRINVNPWLLFLFSPLSDRSIYSSYPTLVPTLYVGFIWERNGQNFVSNSWVFRWSGTKPKELNSRSLTCTWTWSTLWDPGPWAYT